VKLSFVELEGFRGIRAHHKVNFPDGFVVITGRNGAGKSTICDAVEFALTGALSKYDGSERGESSEQYVWWRGRQPAARNLVSVGFRDERGKEFVVTRTPANVAVTGGAHLETALCDISVMTREPLAQICRTAIIRDETIAALSIDLAEADRFTFVRTALGTDALEDVVQRGKGVLSAIKRQVDAATMEYGKSREIVAGLVSELARAKASVADTPDVADAVTRVTALLGLDSAVEPPRLLALARQRIANIRRDNDAMVGVAREVEALRSRLADLESEEQVAHRLSVAELRDRLEPEVQALERERAELSLQADALQRVASTRARLATLYAAGRDIGLHAGACPLCATTMTSNAFETALDKLAWNLAEVDKESAMIRQQLADCDQRLMAANSELRKADAALRMWSTEQDELRGRLTRLAERAREYAEISADGIHADTIMAGVRRAEGQLQVLGQAMSVLEASVGLERIAELEKQVAQAKEHSGVLGERLRELEAAHDRTKRLLSGIRRSVGEVVEERLAALEPLLKDLYGRLRPHNEWTDLTYKVRGDVKKFLSLKVGGEVNPRFTFSSGQRRAIGLAFLLAVHLSRPWCRLKTLVLDDPVQHIDDFRSLHLVEVLAAIRKTGQQIICAVEDEGLADLICRRLRTGTTGEGLLLQMAFRTGEGSTIERAVSVPGAIRHLLLPG
jgi:chromosome segregation protein